MIDQNDNVSNKENIEMAVAELHDLIYFWDNLSVFEHDAVFEIMQDYVDSTSPYLEKMESKLKEKTEKVQKDLESLKSSNIEAKLSVAQQIIDDGLPTQRKNASMKPNWETSMKIIQSLSLAELVELCHYLMPDIEAQDGDTKQIYALIEDVGTNRTLSIFFALRNYLGQKHQCRS
jgi:Mg2+ and Co2+ transporter CorA